MNARTRTLLWQIAVIAGVCWFLFFFRLGAFGLVAADEPRYAQVAREMFARHDWIVPTLNGQPWLEKPVLLYWKIRDSYALFGISDWAARVPCAFHALALVLVVFFFTRRFRPGAELGAALITASSAAVTAFARGASTDILLASYCTIAMLAWWAWFETGRKLWLGFFYVLLAFGALAKGPVAPGLAVLVIATFALIRRDKKLFIRGLWWPGFLLFFAIALPWYVAVQMKVPQFFRLFFIEHNLERFGTNLYQHSQPFWYYLPVFLLSMLPWTLFTILAIAEACQSKVWQTGKKPAEEGDGRDLQLFLLLWIVIPVVFFTISRSKLPGYILPAISPAALLTADYLYRGTLLRWTIVLQAVLCGVLVTAGLLAPSVMLKVYPSRELQAGVLIGAGVAAVVVLLTGTARGSRALPFATLVSVVLIVGFLLGPAAPVIDAFNSARPVEALLQQLRTGHEPVSLFGDVRRQVEYGLNFYCNQPIGRYERDGVPQGDHIVIAQAGSEAALRVKVSPRQVLPVGHFSPQHLEFFSVSK